MASTNCRPGAVVKGSRAFLYLGRGVHYAIAREGALKLKESAYLQAEGYPAGELKHGPNALVSPDAPLVVIATRDPSDPDAMLRYRKVLQLMKDMKAQGATQLVIATEGDEEAAALANYCIEVPKTEDMLATMLEVVPLQLLAYHLAIQNGVDVDHPRNLTKPSCRVRNLVLTTNAGCPISRWDPDFLPRRAGGTRVRLF